MKLLLYFFAADYTSTELQLTKVTQVEVESLPVILEFALKLANCLHSSP